jgi:hypothetical protein|tara:strand:- start:928 stop:1410 length:483 start_codon:yes stop_codon:yes gene_type:complete
MNEKYIQALIVGGLIGGAILLNGQLNKPALPPIHGKAMFITDDKEISWNDGMEEILIEKHVMPHLEMHTDNVDVKKKGQIKILKLDDQGEEIDINIDIDGDITDIENLGVLEQLEGLDIDTDEIKRIIVKATDNISVIEQDTSGKEQEVKVKVRVKKTEE